MIVTELYKGQGLGNQLFAYVMARVVAQDNGYSFGIKNPEYFKGASFMKLDFGESVSGGKIPYEGGTPLKLPNTIEYYFREERLNHSSGADIRTYDTRIKSIKDHTKIDGYFQGEEYFSHRKEEIRQWLAIPDYPMDPNICVVNFRGGEYVGGDELFLPKEYWRNAMNRIKNINSNVRFKVVTDDIETAKIFFPNIEISHNLADDYRAIQNAHYLILSNSSFAILPAWLNKNVKIVIAPKYWARHNVSDGYWSLSYNIVKGWFYLDRDNILSTSEICSSECADYLNKYKDTFWIGEPVFKKQSLIEKIKSHVPRSIKKKIKNILNK